MNLHSTHFSHALQDCHARDYGLNTAKLEQLFLAYGAPEEEGDDEIVLNVQQFEAMLHEAGIMQARPRQQYRSSISILPPYWYHTRPVLVPAGISGSRVTLSHSYLPRPHPARFAHSRVPSRSMSGSSWSTAAALSTAEPILPSHAFST